MRLAVKLHHSDFNRKRLLLYSTRGDTRCQIISLLLYSIVMPRTAVFTAKPLSRERACIIARKTVRGRVARRLNFELKYDSVAPPPAVNELPF